MGVLDRGLVFASAKELNKQERQFYKANWQMWSGAVKPIQNGDLRGGILVYCAV